ncbi:MULTISPECIES: SCO6880 family protein [Streptomyces]|uniref:SCO6880 family protein n=2 Tax=Streptomyces TaxID=1883 RepID=A0ABU2Q4M3_9ACTN|nr:MULTISPECIES: SCO6880 family protein [unclassified Streptomyces]MDT0399388.1 SCO6880 family protein [Streptomyces sp. DSM 41636]MDT0406685.1 SCO6880 family protein [Streptomyces sp. DSM 41635]
MTTETHVSHVIAPRRTYLIGRARPNAIVGRNRETGEIALIVVGAFLGMMCGLLVPVLSVRIVLLAGLPMLALSAVYVPYKGRTFYKWFEINRSFKRTVRRNTTYRSGAAEAGTRLDGREVEIGSPPGIGRITWLAAPFGPDEIAVLLHADRKTVTAAIEIEGPGVGLRDSEDQEALVDRFGTLLKHVANGDGFVTRIQMLARTLPADPDAHAKDVAVRGDDRSPGWLQQSYEQLQSMVSTSSEQHRAYLVACMHYNRELAAEAQTMARAMRSQGGGKVNRDAGLAVVMARELTDICSRLQEADIRVRQPLGQSRLSSLIHSMYDPDHPIDHIQAMSRRNAWPAELDAMEPTYLQAKTRESSTRAPWCHATAWIKEWPMTPVGVNFLAPLLVHTPDVIRTVAVTMDLEPTEVAIERMLTEKTNDEAEASRAAKMNRTVDPRDIAAHGRLDQRGEDLASGAAGVNLVGYITVSSRNPEALARDKRTIRASAGKSYLKVEWCDREHHRAFVNTLPFATGIRR